MPPATLTAVNAIDYQRSEATTGMCYTNSICLLYHFDRVFTIVEISRSEKAEKFTFDLW
jgi:hypothetical protein